MPRTGPRGPASCPMARPTCSTPLTVDLVVFPQRGVHRLDVPMTVSGISGVAAVTPVDAAELTAVGRLLRHELEAGVDDAPAMLAALLTQFVVHLRRAWPAGARLTPPRLLARFERLLERDFRHDHRVAAYAGCLGVSARGRRVVRASRLSRRGRSVADASGANLNWLGIRPAGHPAWLRCSSLEYSPDAHSSRLASRAPRRPRCTSRFGSAPLECRHEDPCRCRRSTCP